MMFVDEAQDFNEMQRCLIKECVADNGRVVVVGDPNQAIYGFRGADSNSMDIFKADLVARGREIKEFPLSVSWRCPHTVVKEANRYVQNFTCPDSADDGSVVVNASFNPVRGDIVLCRYNAPLINAFYQMILDGKSCYILGRDMTKGLINHVKKITKDERMLTSGLLLVLNLLLLMNCVVFVTSDAIIRRIILKIRSNVFAFSQLASKLLERLSLKSSVCLTARNTVM